MSITSLGMPNSYAYVPANSRDRPINESRFPDAIKFETTTRRTGLGMGYLEESSIAAQMRIQSSAKEKETRSLTIHEKLALIAEEGKKVDHSNMSDKELLEEVYTRFGKYLDKDIFPPFSGNPLFDQGLVVNALHSELYDHGYSKWSYERSVKAYAEFMGYGGMTQEETKKAIAEKYASQEKTPCNFMRMLTEMKRTGAMDARAINDTCRTVLNSIEMNVMRKLVKDAGYTFWEILSDWRGIAEGAVWEAFNEETSVSDLFIGADYMMTKGGWVNLEIENNVNNIFKELRKLGLQ